ncbi:MAG: tRNA (guanosine(46)-N7)-methyltransferase TrmB [Rubrivivax sp.]|nr:tRNA (guanosine(46)-N7)-methyltransferase TrmB [Rubrivivax sp.]
MTADPSDATPTPPLPPVQPRGVKSYVLRGGRLGPGQQRALESLGPTHVLPYQDTPPDWAAVFGREAPRIVEIGFGMGQATAAIAAARPEVDFIGVEVHEAGVGSLLKLIGEQALRNLRIVRHDAVEVLQHMVAPASLAGVHVYFPDPWPKKRHHKRRLIQPPLAVLLAARLAPGGVLHCATDWEPYAEQMLQVLSATPGLANTAGSGYAERPAYRPLTRFEARGLALGHGVRDLLFAKT